MSPRECPCCASEYDDSVIPVLLSCCRKDMCMSCCERDHARQVAELAKNRKMVCCMWCKQKYHCIKQVPWTVNELACALLGIDTNSLPHTATQDAPPKIAGKRARAATGTTQQSQEQQNDGTGVAEMEASGPNVRSSLRIRQRNNAIMTEAEVEEEVITGSLEMGRRSISLDQLHMVTSTQSDERGNEVNNESDDENEIADENETETANNAGDPEMVEGEFLQLARRARRLFRIRHFVGLTKSPPQDKFGRNCSYWCIDNNYCAACDRVLVPNKRISYPQDAMRYLRESDIEVIKNSCRGSDLFTESSKSFGTYCNSYKRFACMEKGDFVAMLVPGPTGKGEAYFGVISSNNLILMNSTKAAEQAFPAMKLFTEYEWRGLMLRKVRWMRKGYVRDLPGQKEGKKGANSLPWLVESGPFWFLEPSKESHALDMITRQDFLDNTVSLG